MRAPFKILSTDFDGTLHAEFEDPPVPRKLETLIQNLQKNGVTWVINTGRDLSSLMETLGRARLSIWPDYVVTVEREIHARNPASDYTPVEHWNCRCAQAHEEIFRQVRLDLPRLLEWIHARFKATTYEDLYSPFCLIAQNPADAEAIHEYLESYCQSVPKLTVVRNDVYARFSHAEFNKGSALGEIGRLLSISSEEIVAVGDHLNDLPMLSNQYARWLIAPHNAVERVKETVRRQCGFISSQLHGHGMLEGLEMILRNETGIGSIPSE